MREEQDGAMVRIGRQSCRVDRHRDLVSVPSDRPVTATVHRC